MGTFLSRNNAAVIVPQPDRISDVRRTPVCEFYERFPVATHSPSESEQSSLNLEVSYA